MDSIDRRRVALIVAFTALVFTGGTLGFMALLHESWHEALYRAFISASLTGLDSTPHGLGAELLTIALVLSGVAIFGYLAAQLVDTIARGILGGAWKEKRRRKVIDHTSDHIIICGYGRVGRRAAEEFRGAGVPFVVLDFSEDALAHAREDDALCVVGSGTQDDDLGRAGLLRARGLLAASDSDADNLYITLSAKSQRPDLTVIARASDEDAERKLKLAGADRVVTPYTSAGRVMANLMVKPQVTAFLNILTSARNPEISFEEIVVTASCGAAGRTIRELDVFEATGAYIVAVRKSDGTLNTRPAKDTRLETGDVIVGVGAPDEIRGLERLFQPADALAR